MLAPCLPEYFFSLFIQRPLCFPAQRLGWGQGLHHESPIPHCTMLRLSLGGFFARFSTFPYEGRCCVSWAPCWWRGKSLDQNPQAKRGLVPHSASLFVEKANKLPSASTTLVTMTPRLAAPSKSEGPGAIASP